VLREILFLTFITVNKRAYLYRLMEEPQNNVLKLGNISQELASLSWSQITTGYTAIFDHFHNFGAVIWPQTQQIQRLTICTDTRWLGNT